MSRVRVVGFVGGVALMDANGSNQTNLTNNPNSQFDVEPSWSPDGTRLSHTSNNEIYVMDASGANQTRITTNDVYDFEPSWQPISVAPTTTTTAAPTDTAPSAAAKAVTAAPAFTG